MRSGARSAMQAVISSSRGTMMPIRQNLSAERLFMLQTLNPKACSGTRGIKFKSDNVQIPRVAFNFNSVFTLLSNDANSKFKIKFNVSPLVIAEILPIADPDSPSTPFPKIIGARSFIQDDRIYVLGSKIGQLGELDENFDFTVDSAWKKFRATGMSAASTWVGREIDKGGVVYCARMNDTIPLEDFEPTSKMDAIYSEAWKTQTVTAMHKEPVYSPQYIDPNEAAVDEPASRPEAVRVSFECTFANFWDGNTTQLSITNQGAFLAVGNITSTYNTAQKTMQNFTALDSAVFRDVNIRYLQYQLDIFDRHWGIINRSSSGTVSIEVPITFELQPFFKRPAPDIPTSNAISVNLSTTTFTSADTYALSKLILTAIADACTSAPLSTALTSGQFSPRLTISFQITATNLMIKNYKRSNIPLNRNIVAQIANDNFDGLFDDSAFALPVMEFTVASGSVGGSTAFQFVHNVNLELMVQDTNVLGNFAMANNSDSKSDVLDVENERLQKIMKALPPMITYDNDQISSTAKTELASRGILGDITSLLGPIATAVFPEFAPLISAGSGIANTLDKLIFQ